MQNVKNKPQSPRTLIKMSNANNCRKEISPLKIWQPNFFSKMSFNMRKPQTAECQIKLFV